MSSDGRADYKHHPSCGLQKTKIGKGLDRPLPPWEDQFFGAASLGTLSAFLMFLAILSPLERKKEGSPFNWFSMTRRQLPQKTVIMSNVMIALALR
jgi:hypothetical protein